MLGSTSPPPMGRDVALQTLHAPRHCRHCKMHLWPKNHRDAQNDCIILPLQRFPPIPCQFFWVGTVPVGSDFLMRKTCLLRRRHTGERYIYIYGCGLGGSSEHCQKWAGLLRRLSGRPTACLAASLPPFLTTLLLLQLLRPPRTTQGRSASQSRNRPASHVGPTPRYTYPYALQDRSVPTSDLPAANILSSLEKEAVSCSKCGAPTTCSCCSKRRLPLQVGP